MLSLDIKSIIIADVTPNILHVKDKLYTTTYNKLFSNLHPITLSSNKYMTNPIMYTFKEFSTTINNDNTNNKYKDNSLIFITARIGL